MRTDGGRKDAGGGTRYLSFKLAAETFAFELSRVREVIALGELTPVPFMPPHFKGVMNLRGRIVSVIDARVKIGMPALAPQPETAIIIVDFPEAVLGVAVDTVDSVFSATEDDVDKAPELRSHTRVQYLKGIVHRQERLVLIVDVDKLLQTDVEKANEKKETAS
ncbi:MAG: purine-binding chemotaxis protein CheW [Silvanigrellales bacterium]|jgi:purine-binding chemotaxis protein CheW|nr:purine-binding chemotaxis protein CheW [Silvanigrellales bacterium]